MMRNNPPAVFSELSMTAVLITFLSASPLEADDPVKLTVKDDGFAAHWYPATDPDKRVGVIVLGGSEGGLPLRHARALAKEGFSVLVLGYFKLPGTPTHLDEIPLEYFDQPIAWFGKQECMQGRATVLLGSSKGAELALLLASRKPEIGGVIGRSPSCVVFQGIPKIFWPPRSSWSDNGKSVPFVPYDASRGVDMKNLRPLYELSLSHRDKAKAAAIPVEKIEGPILLLSGEEDGIWPATDMAEAMFKRRMESPAMHSIRHVRYEQAGHTLDERFMIGGTKQGNRKARLDSWKEILSFLNEFGVEESEE